MSGWDRFWAGRALETMGCGGSPGRRSSDLLAKLREVRYIPFFLLHEAARRSFRLSDKLSSWTVRGHRQLSTTLVDIDANEPNFSNGGETLAREQEPPCREFVLGGGLQLLCDPTLKLTIAFISATVDVFCAPLKAMVFRTVFQLLWRCTLQGTSRPWHEGGRHARRWTG